jgi:hypothetical protein
LTKKPGDPEAIDSLRDGWETLGYGERRDTRVSTGYYRKALSYADRAAEIQPASISETRIHLEVLRLLAASLERAVEGPKSRLFACGWSICGSSSTACTRDRRIFNANCEFDLLGKRYAFLSHVTKLVILASDSWIPRPTRLLPSPWALR